MPNQTPHPPAVKQYEPKGFHALCLLDAPERVPSWWRSRWSQLYQWASSCSGKTGLIGGSLLIGMVLLLGWHHIALSPSGDGLALTDVYATRPMQVLDKEATDLKLEQARSALPPMYQPADTLNQRMRQTLSQRLTALQHMLQGPGSLTSPTLQTRFYANVGDGDDAVAVLNQLINRPMMRRDPFYWDTVRMGAEATLNKILEAGLTRQDYLESRYHLIDQAMPKALLDTPEERSLVRLVVKSVLRPNRLLDERAQHLAYLRLASQVKSVYHTYHKGDVVVTQGEPLTDLHRRALREMGIAVDKTHWLGLLGTGLLCLFMVGTLWGGLYQLEQHRLFKPKYAALLAVMTGVTTLSMLVMTSVWHDLPLLWFPFAAYPLILSILIHPRIGFLAGILLILLLVLTQHLELEPMAVLLLGSVAGGFALSRDVYFTDRRHLVMAMMAVSLANGLTVLALALINSPSYTAGFWTPLAWSLLAAIGSGLMSGILTVGLLPILESLFGLLSPYTLLELANHDQPLLRRLQFEAPGTFHHSLMLASLSEAAAEAIGANALLARVGCLYHDIGKMRRPLYFIENQSYFGSDNPHDRLPPRLSKRVITAHTKDGLEMAQQYGLPEEIQAFIPEHHGTLLCGYFYQRALKDEGDQNVNKDQFRYAGPKPRSRETGIVMLADATESAVRALKNPSQNQVEELVDKLFRQRIEDGQFDECPLTFQDLRTIRATFLRVLMGIQHQRINYQEKMLAEFNHRSDFPHNLPPVAAALLAESVPLAKPAPSLPVAPAPTGKIDPQSA